LPPSARLFFDWLDPAREGAEDTVQT